jgi:hypothetical protein
MLGERRNKLPLTSVSKRPQGIQFVHPRTKFKRCEQLKLACRLRFYFYISSCQQLVSYYWTNSKILLSCSNRSILAMQATNLPSKTPHQDLALTTNQINTLSEPPLVKQNRIPEQ